MHKHILTILTLLTAATATRAQHWQQQVNYSIDAALTDSNHTLDGSIRIDYINRSPDTLSYIWIRCWPNAFKNDRTDFSEELIRYGRRDFYFSDKSQRGYINRLEFRVDGRLVHMEDHPQYLDVIRVSLPKPLIPGAHATLSSPFHVQLPDNFSHLGYHGGIYEISHWYPSPAVYDEHGWHPEPYMDHVGAYNEYGDFDVRITLPANFVVAASGELETGHPVSEAVLPSDQSNPPPSSRLNPPPRPRPGPAPIATKTLHYHASNLPDFAWFASRLFRTDHDTLNLPSGRMIDIYSLHLPDRSDGKRKLRYLKDAIRFYDTTLGEYPYSSATVAETLHDANDPMRPSNTGSSYPGLIGIDGRVYDSFAINMSIVKAIGGNWLSVAMSTNARRWPWMSEGVGMYYYRRYQFQAYNYPFGEWMSSYDTFYHATVNTQAVLREDQPISTSFDSLSPDNFQIIAGYKTSIWVLELRRYLGAALFDSCMRSWFRQEQFHHSGPEDLKGAFTNTAGRNVDSIFALLDSTGPVPPNPYHRKIEVWPQILPPHPSFSNANHLNISPALGFNDYDHFMVGAMIHNFNLPPDHFQVLATALYGTVSHKLNGLFVANYSWYPDRGFHRIDAGANGSRFSTSSGTDSSGREIYGGFYKVVPYLRVFFPRPSVGSTRESWLEWKTFLIGESSFDNYVLKSTDSLYYPTPGKYQFRYLNQLSYTIRDTRVLYPYSILVQAQQAAPFYRINLDINYFFNYDQGGGFAFRLFGAKFGYLGGRNPATDLTAFEPKLTALRGTEDYTYQDYFIGRSQFTGLASQQILERDGNLPLRTDLFQGLQGRSDNWVGAINMTSTLPPAIVPKWLPLRIFLDVGTYAGAWGDNPPTSHFLYVGGFQLGLLHDVVTIYAPLVYSSDFSNQLKTVPGQNGFFQKISFSLNMQQIPFPKGVNILRPDAGQ